MCRLFLLTWDTMATSAAMAPVVESSSSRISSQHSDKASASTKPSICQDDIKSAPQAFLKNNNDGMCDCHIFVPFGLQHQQLNAASRGGDTAMDKGSVCPTTPHSSPTTFHSLTAADSSTTIAFVTSPLIQMA